MDLFNWPTIISETIGGSIGGLISGYLILKATDRINKHDDARKRQAEKEYLLTKEEIKNLSELNELLAKNIELLIKLSKVTKYNEAELVYENVTINQTLIIELIITGLFKEDNEKDFLEFFGNTNQKINKFEIISIDTIENNVKNEKIEEVVDVKFDQDALYSLLQELYAFKTEVVKAKRNCYLELNGIL